MPKNKQHAYPGNKMFGYRVTPLTPATPVPAGWLRGWKVVYVGPRGGLSSPGSCRGLRRYAPRKITVPLRGLGPLAVFNTKANALQFIRTEFHPLARPTLVCIRCAYKPSTKTRAWCLTPNMYQELRWMAEGSRLADAVLLLDGVQKEVAYAR